MTSHREPPPSDPIRWLRIVAAVLCSVVVLGIASPMVGTAGASVVAAPAERHGDSVPDPISFEGAAPEQRLRTPAVAEPSRHRSTERAHRLRIGVANLSGNDLPAAFHLPALVPPGRAPPADSV